MRFFAFIMALMVLTLSAMPCMDEPYVINQASEHTLVAASNHSHDHSDGDACSPFCTCSCCFAGFTVLHAVLLNQHSLFAPAKMYASYLPSTIIAISLPIWQPPRLS